MQEHLIIIQQSKKKKKKRNKQSFQNALAKRRRQQIHTYIPQVPLNFGYARGAADKHNLIDVRGLHTQVLHKAVDRQQASIEQGTAAGLHHY